VRASEIAIRFAERINAHDVEGLIALMTPDHSFVDSLGKRFRRPAIEDGWRSYFQMVPDYWVKIEDKISEGKTAVLVGVAGGTFVSEGGVRGPENRWKTPAVWIARIEGTRVAEWRIYADNEPIRGMARNQKRVTGARARSSRLAE
jgi:ketosteroid isomerase-like protein